MAAINRKVRIYRKLVAGDTFGSLASTEKLEFNTSKDPENPNGWTTRIGPITKGRGLADNSNPNGPLGEHQDTGTDEYTIQIEGAVSRADDVSNVFKVNLNSYQNDGQESTDLPFGRISIEIDRDPNENLIASVADGLKVRSLIWDMDEEIPNQTNFILILEKAENP